MDILNKIDELRKAKGWSMNRLAVEAELTQSTIAHMFSRGTTPSLQTLLNICDAFGISAAQFFSEETEPEYLSADEKELLNNYRRLDEKQKEAIKNIASLL